MAIGKDFHFCCSVGDNIYISDHLIVSFIDISYLTFASLLVSGITLAHGKVYTCRGAHVSFSLIKSLSDYHYMEIKDLLFWLVASTL